MLAAIAAGSLLAMTPVQWSLYDRQATGEQICALSQTYEEGTKITIMVRKDDWEKNHFLVFAVNPAWSFAPGEELGDISAQADGYRFGSQATGDGNTFFFFGVKQALDPFLEAAAKSGFKLVRKGTKIIGDYNPAGLGDSIRGFQRCVKTHFDWADPFAD